MEAFVISMMGAIGTVLLGLLTAVGALYKEVRRIADTEAICQAELAGVKVELRLHREEQERMHKENAEKLSQIKDAVKNGHN